VTDAATAARAPLSDLQRVPDVLEISAVNPADASRPTDPTIALTNRRG